MTSDKTANPHGPASSPEDVLSLSDHDFKIYNRMAERMEQFHNYFRQSWTLLHTAATTSRRPRNLTQKQFLATAISLTEHLNAHHSIEEVHIFPVLATRMPEFDPQRGLLVQQHALIHDGLVNFEDYVRRCHDGTLPFEMDVLREKMDSWGGVLWEHLDEEVRLLGAEKMRLIWSKDEMKMLPI
ncbi:hypothetical protein E4U21_007684 [Claviceps maximensis]|nr:hypothetical protein E4U21_007684 [Claviceps maximensis]